MNLLLCSPRASTRVPLPLSLPVIPRKRNPRGTRDPAVANAFLTGMATLDAERDAVFEVLRARGLAPTEDQVTRINACTNLAQIQSWLRLPQGGTSEGGRPAEIATQATSFMFVRTSMMYDSACGCFGAPE